MRGGEHRLSIYLLHDSVVCENGALSPAIAVLCLSLYVISTTIVNAEFQEDGVTDVKMNSW